MVVSKSGGHLAILTFEKNLKSFLFKMNTNCFSKTKARHANHRTTTPWFTESTGAEATNGSAKKDKANLTEDGKPSSRRESLSQIPF